MPSLVLYALENSRGYTEKIRMFLAETGMKYDEQRVDQSTVDAWTASGKINFGILPALEVDGIVIESSAAILQYLAELADSNKLGQGGNKYCGEPAEKAVILGLSLMVDRFQGEIKTFNGPSNQPTDASNVIAKWFGYFQERLERNDDNDVKSDEFLYGKHLTFADIALFEAVNAVCNTYGVLKSLRPYPKLKEFHDKVASRARIEHHIATRPEGF